MANVIYEALAFSPKLALTIGKGHWYEGMFWYAGNVATDICCLLIPAAIVLPLELRRAKKIAIVALFALSIIPNAAGIWSWVFFLQIVQEISAADPEHYFEVRKRSLRGNLTLTLIESNVGIICAGIPTIWILFAHFLPSMIRYYLHPSRYRSSATRLSTTATTTAAKDRMPKRRNHSRARSLSMDDMPPAMRWDSDEPISSAPQHQTQSSESSKAILRASPTIAEEEEEEEDDSIGDRCGTASSKGADDVENARPPNAVTGAGITVQTDFAIERSGGDSPSHGTRFSYASDSIQKS
ncbi:Myosin-1 [Apiospora arundinis]